MDGHQFDHLVCTLTTSRRSVAGLTLAASSAIFGRDLAAARKPKKKPCPPCKKRRKGKCKGLLPDGAACPGGTCRAGACAPAELPCGAACAPACPRCPNGRACQHRDDCLSAMCDLQTFTCQGCAITADCGKNEDGQCSCRTTLQGAQVCHGGGATQNLASCTQCAAPRSCVPLSPGNVLCMPLC